MANAERRFGSVVSSYTSAAPYYDEPKPYLFLAQLVDPISLAARIGAGPVGSCQSRDGNLGHADRSTRSENVGHAGGCSFSKERAFTKMIGESIERFAVIGRVDEQHLVGSFQELWGKGLSAMNPDLIAAGEKREPLSRQGLTLSWLKGYDDAGHDILVPAQLVNTPHFFRTDEVVLRTPITTGAACGPDRTFAEIAGICEVVERDAFMRSWLTCAKPTRINLVFPPSQRDDEDVSLLASTISECTRYQMVPEFYRLASDIPALEVIMCVLWDSTQRFPRFTLATKAHWNKVQALLGALEEAMQLRPWLRQVAEGDLSITSESTRIPNSLNDRARYTLLPSTIDAVSTWLSGPAVESITVKIERGSDQISREELRRTLPQQIRTAGGSLTFVDLTYRLPADVADQGFVVIKAIVPEFQPLYLTEDLKDIAFPRLLPNSSLQPMPHPFL